MGTDQFEFSKPSIQVELLEGGPKLLELIGLLASPAEASERRGFYPKSFFFTFRLPDGELKMLSLHIHGVEGLSYPRHAERQVHLVDGTGSAIPRDESGGERSEVVHYIGTYNFHTGTGQGELQFRVVRH